MNGCSFIADLIPSRTCQTPTGIAYSGLISRRTKTAAWILFFDKYSATPSFAAKYAPAIAGG